MNVINKIKSKKNKEQSSSQIQTQEPRQSKKQQKKLQAPSSNIEKPIKVSSQAIIQLRPQEKSHSMKQDIDEVSINEYYTRKDKKIQMLNRIQSSDNFNEQSLKSAPYCFNIKKSSAIGDICVLQGEIISQKHGKEVYRKKVKLSCSIDTIPFPQTISKILLQEVTMLTNEQGIFVGQKIEKIIQKSGKK